MNREDKAASIMKELWVREIVTFDDILIYTRTKLWLVSWNIFAVGVLAERKALTPFLEQPAWVIDKLYNIIEMKPTK